jgi:3-dehydroquinate dehydratase-2
MAVKHIYIINGPNLNLLGRREVDIYGDMSFEKYYEKLVKQYQHCQLHYFQSNHEGRLIDKLQEIGYLKDHAVIINAGGYTHTSIALGDTLAAIAVPVVEVHISDIASREAFRQHSFLKPHVTHFISGKGLAGYEEAIKFVLDL